MAERMVKCVKLQRELPGLDRPPFNDDLGKRIYENVSKEAWGMFREHLKMVINEYRLVLGTEEANKIIEQQTEDYFFGPGAALPPGYVPPKAK
jgi:Fe-S cluster biosynthesis and repair protein YggX